MADELLDFVRTLSPEYEGLRGVGESDTPIGDTPPVPSAGPSALSAEPSALSRFASNIGSGVGKVGSAIGREFTSSPLSAFAKLLTTGALGLGMANQVNMQRQVGRQTQAIERGQKLAQSAAAPAIDFGKEQLRRAEANQLSPALQAQIDQWKKTAKTAWVSRLASMGLGNSTALEQVDREIERQALAMQASMLAQEQETGLSALQTGVGAGTSVMGTGTNQQAALAQLIQSANQTLGLLAGRQG